jgi:hypothetical protein
LARSKTKTNRGLHIWARFGIRTRADDRATLELIRSFWGCGLLVRQEPNKSQKIDSKPCVTFAVTSAVDLFNVVAPHFHRHPLVAKKKRDFVIWEQGLDLVYRVSRRKLQAASCKGHRRAGFLPKWTAEETADFLALRAALKAQRVYNAAAVELPAPRPPRPEPPSLFDRLP